MRLADVEPNRPELVMARLPHLDLGHPIKNFARIEITKNPALELQQERRMNRIAEVEQNVRSGQAFEQRLFRHPDAADRVEVVLVVKGFVVKKAIPPA